MTFDELRVKHPQFVYQSFDWRHAGETLEIKFQYLLEPDIAFTARLSIEAVKAIQIETLGKDALDNWVFHLGIIELFSYWKAATPAKIVIEAGHLDELQLAWWQDLLIHSMGEFFYTNHLDFTVPGFVEFISADKQQTDQLSQAAANGQTSKTQANQPPTPITSNQVTEPSPTYLVPVGGGKDSAVVLELLEENNLAYDILLSAPQSPAAAHIAAQSHATNLIKISRTLDPKLLELNQAGYLNGHTPFSARLAFETSLVTAVLGHQQILLGNEFSANEGNVPYLGTTINHQYSKTFEFETSFRQYVQTYLTANTSHTPEYLSLLRPILELQIAGIFAKYPRYQAIFRSCNRNQQDGTWCNQCAKCLFVFTILYPFLEENQLIGPIFASNLFEDASLQPLALALLGKDEHKPFECVGTHQETLAAFQLSIAKFQRLHPDQALPAVLAFVQKNALDQEPSAAQLGQETLCFWNDEHHLNEQLTKIVRTAQERLCQQFDQQ